MVDGLNPDADDVRHPGDYIEEEMVPYIDRAISGENVYSQDIIDTTWEMCIRDIDRSFCFLFH